MLCSGLGLCFSVVPSRQWDCEMWRLLVTYVTLDQFLKPLIHLWYLLINFAENATILHLYCSVWYRAIWWGSRKNVQEKMSVFVLVMLIMEWWIAVANWYFVTEVLQSCVEKTVTVCVQWARGRKEKKNWLHKRSMCSYIAV